MPLRRQQIKDQLRALAEALRLGRLGCYKFHHNPFQHPRQRDGEREEEGGLHADFGGGSRL